MKSHNLKIDKDKVGKKGTCQRKWQTHEHNFISHLESTNYTKNLGFLSYLVFPVLPFQCIIFYSGFTCFCTLNGRTQSLQKLLWTHPQVSAEVSFSQKGFFQSLSLKSVCLIIAHLGICFIALPLPSLLDYYLEAGGLDGFSLLYTYCLTVPGA